ncbi:netrin receptor UNC5A-like, partial [Salvelinus sp. IW2-2015]|uniref:netrin receptor UNC5A-like n=1 Tax=Salvelinus sp. IW2-2015 TaxID=2691554 RepID=UPI0038D42687
MDESATSASRPPLLAAVDQDHHDGVMRVRQRATGYNTHVQGHILNPCSLRENSHLLTIQPDLTTTTTSYQGTLHSRHDGTAKFSLTNGPLLDPLPNGSHHTLHNGKLSSDPAEFMTRLSNQTYFKTLPRDVANTSYGTFNFLGGRLTIPNTGKIVWQSCSQPWLPLAGCQTLLSPIVSCGPPGVVLTRPTILSMDHCSDACPENWAIRPEETELEGVWE